MRTRAFGRNVFAICVIASLVLVSPTRAQASTIVDFESLTPNTIVNGVYGGVNWGTNQWVVSTYGFLPYPTPASTGPQAVYFNPGTGYTKSFTFLTPQIFQGAWFSGPGTYFDPLNGQLYGTQLVFNLYDSSNNLLFTSGSVTTNSVAQYVGFAGYQWISGTSQFLASGYALPVSSVQVAIVNAGQIPNNSSFVMDGVTFDAPTGTPTGTPVPEPTSLALLAGGLLLVVARRARRRG